MGIKHFSEDELNAGLATVEQAPADGGQLRLISRRPDIGQRELLEEGQLDLSEGLVGDNWGTRRQDPNIDAQLTIMNSRSAQLVAGSQERWSLAGDQLYVDMDLSVDNMPAGTRLNIGSAQVEVTAEPHPGCKKFVERFGMDAMLFVNNDRGKELRLRGVNTRVVKAGTIRVGDTVTKG